MEIITKPMIASVATVDGNKPIVRYMVVFYGGEGLNLVTTTRLDSRKVEQMKKNENIHITLGEASSSLNFTGSYLQFAGTVEVRTDIETKKKYWADMLAQFYKGPEDPNFAVLIFKPDTIELLGSDHENPMSVLVWNN